MPAITALAIAAAVPVVRVIKALTGRAMGGAKHVAKWMRNRRDLMRLGECDDRMLRDIGLTRSDVLTAFDEPFWRDPAEFLSARASENRGGARTPALDCVNAIRPPSPLFNAPPVRCYPPADRPAHRLM